MFSNIRDIIKNSELVGNLVDKVSEKVDELTDGQVQLDSLGQVKVDGNKYVDEIMTNLNQTLEEKRLNALELPDKSLEFEKAVACGIVLPGTADLTSGNISGLASFCRMEETQMNINVFGDPIISASRSIGVKRTAVDYLVNLNIFCFDQDASVEGSLSDIRITFGFKVNRDFTVSLDKFDFKYLGDLDLKFKDFEAFNDIASTVISEELQKTVKGSVLEYLQKHIKTIIIELLSKYGIDL